MEVRQAEVDRGAVSREEGILLWYKHLQNGLHGGLDLSEDVRGADAGLDPSGRLLIYAGCIGVFKVCQDDAPP